MRKVSEYRAHAEECRRMASVSNNPEHQQQLMQMAETWEMLADARARELKRARRVADLVDFPSLGPPSSDPHRR